MRHFKASAGGTAPRGESARLNPPSQPPAVVLGATDLTVDQADVLRGQILALTDLLDRYGMTSVMLIHKLTDTAAFDVFPTGGLSEVGRQRTWDVAIGKSHDVHLHLRPAESEREA